jgi:hypothetical protein
MSTCGAGLPSTEEVTVSYKRKCANGVPYTPAYLRSGDHRSARTLIRWTRE